MGEGDASEEVVRWRALAAEREEEVSVKERVVISGELEYRPG